MWILVDTRLVGQIRQSGQRWAEQFLHHQPIPVGIERFRIVALRRGQPPGRRRHRRPGDAELPEVSPGTLVDAMQPLIFPTHERQCHTGTIGELVAQPRDELLVGRTHRPVIQQAVDPNADVAGIGMETPSIPDSQHNFELGPVGFVEQEMQSLECALVVPAARREHRLEIAPGHQQDHRIEAVAGYPREVLADTAAAETGDEIRRPLPPKVMRRYQGLYRGRRRRCCRRGRDRGPGRPARVSIGFRACCPKQHEHAQCGQLHARKESVATHTRSRKPIELKLTGTGRPSTTMSYEPVETWLQPKTGWYLQLGL